MGDFFYDGAHGITFEYGGKSMHTWGEWHLAPKSRPYVAAPPIKEEYIDVPGADGSLDYTEVLAGTVRYGMRTGSWTFIMDNGFNVDPFTFQSEILAFMHGKKVKVILDDDPEYYYIGRITLDPKLDPRDYNQISMKYNLEPYKHPINDTSGIEWKWRELFGNIIIYGKFTVRGTKVRTILNDTGSEIEATINVSNPMTLIFGGQTTSLITGDNAINLPIGANVMTFKGTGIVTVAYTRGKKL